MNTTTQLTPEQLALYVGCEAEKKFYDGLIKVEVISGLTLYLLKTQPDRLVSVKPILRKLSDITEEEALAIGYQQEVFWTGLPADLNPETMVYLLSIGIDLFKWIEQELAIDKTTLNQKP